MDSLCKSCGSMDHNGEEVNQFLDACLTEEDVIGVIHMLMSKMQMTPGMIGVHLHSVKPLADTSEIIQNCFQQPEVALDFIEGLVPESDTWEKWRLLRGIGIFDLETLEPIFTDRYG